MVCLGEQENVRLACACLPVRKNRAIVAQEHLVEHAAHRVLVHHPLVGLGTKDMVKRIGLGPRAAVRAERRRTRRRATGIHMHLAASRPCGLQHIRIVLRGAAG